MSYGLIPYVVDLEDLRAAVGSKDESLLAAVIQGDPEAFEDEDEDEEEIPLSRAVRELIMGEEPDAGSAHQYGYALEQLCRHLGEVILPEEWSAVRWDAVEDTGLEETLTRSGPPVPLPPIDDFPTIGYLTAEEVRAKVAAIGDVHLPLPDAAARRKKARSRSRMRSVIFGLFGMRDPRRVGTDAESQAEWDEGLRELLAEYEGWLREAAAKNRAIVFFYY